MKNRNLMREKVIKKSFETVKVKMVNTSSNMLLLEELIEKVGNKEKNVVLCC